MDILSGVFSRVRSISNPTPAPPRGPNVAANFDSRTTSLTRKPSDTSIPEPPKIQIQPTADTQQDIVKLSVLKSMAFSPCIKLQAKEHVQVSLQHLDNLKCGTLTIRGRVWLLRMRAGRDQMQQRRDIQCYQRLKEAQVSPIHLDQIQKDLDRTYPQYAIFHEATFQKAMSDVLHAIAAYRPEVGYCQGMGYIVGFLNTLMTEEDTFWFVIQMMDKLGMSNYWSPSLSALPKSFFLIEKLIDTHLPRLGRHFKETGMCPSMYATPWIMTLFLYNYSIPFVTRLWDLILYEGLYYVYVIALSILTAHEDEMLTMQMEDLMSLLQPSSRRGEEEQDVEEVLRRANRMKFSIHASLVKFEDQWMHQQLTKEGISMHATI